MKKEVEQIAKKNSPFAESIQSSVKDDGTLEFKYRDSRVYYWILDHLGFAFEKGINPKDIWTGQLTGEEALNYIMITKISHLSHLKGE